MAEGGLAQSHGGTIIATARRLGVKVEDLVDFSSNLSPFGPPAGLLRHLQDHLSQLAVLPEIDNKGLVHGFAQAHGCSAEQVLAGNGTTDFIFQLPKLLAGRRALLIQPSYNDYLLSCQRAGVPTSCLQLTAQQDFQLHLDDLAGKLQDRDMVFLCNPNNPTGQLLDSKLLHQFVASYPQVNFVVDESYLPFTRQQSLLAYDSLANLYILCSSSKIYGMPGLRLGFLVGTGHCLDQLRAAQRPWSVNRLAQLAGEYLFAHGQDHVSEVVDYVEVQRPQFVSALEQLGMSITPGQTNFILSRLPEARNDAAWLQEQLLTKGIMIRNCANFEGLDSSYFRVSLQRPRENSLLLVTLAGILAQCE